MARRPSINSARTCITCSLIAVCYSVTNESRMVQLTEHCRAASQRAYPARWFAERLDRSWVLMCPQLWTISKDMGIRGLVLLPEHGPDCENGCR